MVMSLNVVGLCVVQDVVFNYMVVSGQVECSVFDKIVFGYYYCLNVNGGVENFICCLNIVIEYIMMCCLMVDILVLMVCEYKVDGFCFDLMGYYMVVDMQVVCCVLDVLIFVKDGVDGKQIYFYGEGWDFGEVQGNWCGVNVMQFNFYGVGIGIFNDCVCDVLCGGSFFGGLQEQGVVIGLVIVFNG